MDKTFSKASAKAKQPTMDVWASLGFDSALRPEVVAKRVAVRQAMEEIYPDLSTFINRQETPRFFFKKMKELGLAGLTLRSHGGLAYSAPEVGAILYELARCDASLATVVFLHNGFGLVDVLGDEAQK